MTMHTDAPQPQAPAPAPAPLTLADGTPDIRAILQHCPRVAVLGVSSKAERAGHYVPAYLRAHGYDIVGINPAMAGQQLFDAPIAASLSDVSTPIDVVDVFRRSEDLAAHLAELLAMSPKPKVVWLQLGVFDAAVVAALQAEGIVVVVNHCMLAEHRNLALGAPSLAS